MNHYSVHPTTVYADTSAEPSASERARLSHPMTDVERAQFGAGLEDVARRTARMTDDDIERFLDGLETPDAR